MPNSKRTRIVHNVNGSPAIIFTGLDIKATNISIDDFVSIEVLENQIIITKSKQNKILKRMNAKNASIADLVDKFNLEEVL